MAYGLQVFNSSGIKTLDIQDRLTRVIYSVVATVPSGANYFEIPAVNTPGLSSDLSTWTAYTTSPLMYVRLYSDGVQGRIRCYPNANEYLVTAVTATVIVLRF